jgi:ABC-type uncharacterized transport system permease subunit
MRRAGPRQWTYVAAGSLAPVVAALGAMVIGGVILRAFGADPFSAYQAMFSGAFGSVDSLTATILKALPLILVGVGITIAFRANVLNIGGEGQMVMGGLAGTVAALAVPDLPPLILLPLVLVVGGLGGALWGAIPGALKAYFEVNEILSTIMLNIVAVQIMNYLLRGPLIDTTQILGSSRIPQTERLSENADLPILIPGTRLHAGVVVAVLAALFAYVLLWRTPIGYRLRAVGLSRNAAHYAGIPVKRSITLALTLSGAMAGLAGAVAVFGSESHRMVTDGSTTGFTGAAGFNGIVAALFGALHPLWTLLSSFVFGGLLVGANRLQRVVQVPGALIVALNGLVVVFVVSSERFRRRLRARVEAAEVAEVAPDASGEAVPAATIDGPTGPAPAAPSRLGSGANE